MSVWWPPDKVREERQRIQAEVDELQVAIDIKRMEFKIVTAHCKHPNQFTHYDYGGGSNQVCPDCKGIR